MWQMIKNDPLLKTAAVIILGVLGFGFAFNIMFGQGASGSMGGEGEMMSNVSPLNNSLTYLLVIAFKLLLIVAVIAALIAVIKLVNKYLIKGEGVKFTNSFKNDQILKIIAFIAILTVGLFFITALFGGAIGMGGLAWILITLVKALLFVSVIGLLAGIAVLIYQNRAVILNKIEINSKGASDTVCGNCNQSVPEEYTFCPSCGVRVKQNCESCGTELRTEWKCCPGCGREI